MEHTYNDIGKSFVDLLSDHLYLLLRYTGTDDELRLMSEIFELVKNRGIEI